MRHRDSGRTDASKRRLRSRNVVDHVVVPGKVVRLREDGGLLSAALLPAACRKSLLQPEPFTAPDSLHRSVAPACPHMRCVPPPCRVAFHSDDSDIPVGVAPYSYPSRGKAVHARKVCESDSGRMSECICGQRSTDIMR
jgi:hypothetical protein